MAVMAAMAARTCSAACAPVAAAPRQLPATTPAAARSLRRRQTQRTAQQQQQQQRWRQRRARVRAPPAAASIFDEPIAPRQPSAPDPQLSNADLLPTPAGSASRTLDARGFAALWVTMVVSVTSYYLAGGLVDAGMSPLQGVATVLLGNLITVVPCVLSAHAGTKYGLPFPVLARAAFGVRGAHLATAARGLVAIAWFGVNSWIGGSTLHSIWCAVGGGGAAGAGAAGSSPSAPELAWFLLFWAAQVAVVVRGIGAIKRLEQLAAPALVALALALLAWALAASGGSAGPLLAAPSRLGWGRELWAVVLPSLTGMVGYWATLALSIADFSRFCPTQRDQLAGQALGLPPSMALFSGVGLVVTSATAVIFGACVADPIELMRRLICGGNGAGGAGGGGGIATALLAGAGLSLATLTTNVAANVVAPANALVALAPRKLSFEAAAAAACVLALLTRPWLLYASFLNFLVAYTALLGPILGVMLADYFLLRRRQLDVDALFSLRADGAYYYAAGVNPAALLAVAAGAAPCLPGLLASVGLAPHPGALLAGVYDAAWFVSSGVAAAVYLAVMRLGGLGKAGGGGGAAAPA